MNILLTGGAGYIGSHTVIELLSAGHRPVIVDNFSNSKPEVLNRLQKITGVIIPFYRADVRDSSELEQIFSTEHIDAVIHFAGLKAVGESVKKPLEYYANNIDSTLRLLEVMQNHGVKSLVFSSSATVYGTPENLPLTESSRTGVGITNPYGQTKFMIEQMLTDISTSDPAWQITLLRYFNPVGAHESGLIGEDPADIPNNLLPYVSQVAVSKRPHVQVFGDDYDTIDGTGVRDYIHVVDLARGHVAALQHLKPGAEPYNLCTGTGTSVLQLISAFEQAAGKPIPYEIVERRAGDIAACYASPAKANAELHWKTEKTIQDACASAWNWQKNNPNGY